MAHLDKVYHCPRCALRFASRNDMTHHLREDHRSFHQGSYDVTQQPGRQAAQAAQQR